jgi:hypothetical protein
VARGGKRASLVSDKKEQEWQQYLEAQIKQIEQAGGQFTSINKMKLKMQWEMKLRLQEEHEKIRLQKNFGNQIRKMRAEDSKLE